MRLRKRSLFLIALLCLSAGLSFAVAAEDEAPEPIYQTAEEMAGMRFAYVKGSVYDKYVNSRVEGATEYFYPSLSDCVAAVEAGKVDGAV